MGFDCAVVDRSETYDWFMIKTGKTGVPNFRIPILIMLGLAHQEGNRRQDKMEEVEFHNSAGGP